MMMQERSFARSILAGALLFAAGVALAAQIATSKGRFPGQPVFIELSGPVIETKTDCRTGGYPI